MVIKMRLVVSLIFLHMMLAYKDINRYIPIRVEGLVLDAATRKPMRGLHVYTKKGEEEAFTNEQGVFQFTSWQSLPIVVTAQEPGGAEKKVKVGGTPVRLTVLFP